MNDEIPKFPHDWGTTYYTYTKLQFATMKLDPNLRIVWSPKLFTQSMYKIVYANANNCQFRGLTVN